MAGQFVQQGPPFSYYTSQINPYDFTGHNNCGQASLITCALAAGSVPPTRAWQSLIDEACLATRGVPDSPYNGYTSLPQMEDGFRHWGIDFYLTYSWDEVYNAPWGLLLVDGNGITLADGSLWYDPSWFGYQYGEPNHFVVYGPRYDGAGDWVMNPLSQYPGDTWAHASIDSLRSSFGCGYILPGLPVSEPPVPPEPPTPSAPPQLTQARFRCIRPEGFGLKPSKQSGGPNLCMVPLNAQGNDTGQRWYDAEDPTGNRTWARLQYGAHGVWYDGYTYGNQKYFERLD